MPTRTIITGGLQFIPALEGDMIVYMPYKTIEDGQEVYKDGWTYYSTIRDAVTTEFTDPLVVDDIAARDLLTPTFNQQVFVVDATADPLVASDGAFYIYNTTNSQWVLTSNAGVSIGVQETFETVNRNLRASGGTVTYDNKRNITSVDYGDIVKTFTYGTGNASDEIQTITLSGPGLPVGIDLTKNFVYNNKGDIESWSYS